MAAVTVFILVLNSAEMSGVCMCCERVTRRTVDGAKVTLDGLLEGAVAELAAALRLGREVLPEEGVVDVSFEREGEQR